MKVVVPEIWDGFRMQDELEAVACIITQRFLGFNLPEGWKGSNLDLHAKKGDRTKRER